MSFILPSSRQTSLGAVKALPIALEGPLRMGWALRLVCIFSFLPYKALWTGAITVLTLQRRKWSSRETEQLVQVLQFASGRAGIESQAVWPYKAPSIHHSSTWSLLTSCVLQITCL
jgi:hypothetical protein